LQKKQIEFCVFIKQHFFACVFFQTQKHNTPMMQRSTIFARRTLLSAAAKNLPATPFVAHASQIQQCLTIQARCKSFLIRQQKLNSSRDINKPIELGTQF